MTPIPKTGLAVLALLTAGTLTPSSAGCAEHDMGAKMLEGAASAEVCAPVGKDELKSIESGSTRLVLTLSEYKPPKSGRGSLTVTMPGGQEQVLGIFPAQAFDREDVNSHRRFFLRPPPEIASHDVASPICGSVKLESADGSGSARVELGTQTLKQGS